MQKRFSSTRSDFTVCQEILDKIKSDIRLRQRTMLLGYGVQSKYDWLPDIICKTNEIREWEVTSY